MIKPEECIGCQACVEFCDKKAISFQFDEWGEGRASVNAALCNNCGLCSLRCPNQTLDFNDKQSMVYATISRENRHTGSSGGIFYELASNFIQQGGVVFGATFDEKLKLIHKKVSTVAELPQLCKSKYLHSDMSGVYTEIANCLKKGINVMFVGTPCQVSAVKNLFSKRYENLLLVDFLCHGTGTQKVFDMCVRAEERKRGGEITDFSFRAKTRKAEHSFQYVLKNGKKAKNFSGYHFEFPYYYSFLKYNIFNESCYECKYSTYQRVGDITLGDFWGIQEYNKELSDKDGVSMLSINTEKGNDYFNRIKSKCMVCEYPIENAANKNQAFRECEGVQSHNSKQELRRVLCEQGEEALVERMRCPNVKKELIYAGAPGVIKKIWNLVRGRK